MNISKMKYLRTNKKNKSMEGIIKFENRQKVLDAISANMDESQEWVFVSKKSFEGKSIAMMMSPDRDRILDCITMVLRQEPEWWNILKNTIDTSDDK